MEDEIKKMNAAFDRLIETQKNVVGHIKEQVKDLAQFHENIKAKAESRSPKTIREEDLA